MRTAASLAWRTALLQYLALLKATLPSQCQELPDPALSPVPWEELWTAYPGQWTSLITKLVERRVQLHCQSAARSTPAVVAIPPLARDAPCPYCNMAVSRKAVLAHQQSKHSRRAAFRAVSASTVCPFCGLSRSATSSWTLKSGPRLLAGLQLAKRIRNLNRVY